MVAETLESHGFIPSIFFLLLAVVAHHVIKVLLRVWQFLCLWIYKEQVRFFMDHAVICGVHEISIIVTHALV